MAYTPTYVADDIDDIVIDFIGSYLVTIIAFVALIALVVLFVWFRKKGKGLVPGG